MKKCIASLLAMGLCGISFAQGCHYVFAYFKGNSTDGQQIWYGVSDDGVNFSPLGDGRPVVPGGIGCSGGLRDPYIMKTGDGRFLMVATDMDYSKGKWSNRGIVMSVSTNLVDWSHSAVHFPERYYGTRFSDVDAVWAPQMIKDGDKYLVYFSLHSPKGGPFPKDTLYWVYANEDFTGLATEPQQLFEYPDPTIDADIVMDGRGLYHLYFNTWGTEGLQRRQYELSDLHDPRTWLLVEGRQQPNVVKSEGSSMWPLPDGSWALGYDCFASGIYQICRTRDFRNYEVVCETRPGDDFAPRHGSVVVLTDDEYDAMLRAFSH